MFLHMVRVLLDALIVFRCMEEDEEGKTFLRQLLGILEGDLTDQRGALVGRPNANLVIAEGERERMIKKE